MEYDHGDGILFGCTMYGVGVAVIQKSVGIPPIN